MLQNTTVKATLGEKQKHAALSLLLPVADLAAVQARKVMARRLPTGKTQSEKTIFRKGTKDKPHLRIYPAAALSGYAAKKDTRNSFAFGISSKLVNRQAEQKARRGIPKTVHVHGNIFTSQTITSRRFFKH